MKSGDKWLLAGGAIIGLAALMWYGDREVKNMSETFAKNFKLPDLPLAGGINVTLPNITMPNVNVTMPDINIATPDLSGLGTLLGRSQQAQDLTAQWNAFQSLWNNTFNNQGTPLGGKYPVVYDASYKPPQVASDYLPPIQDMLKQGGLFVSKNDKAVKPATKSTAEGGNGIFVENGDKDYYVQDNSMYGRAGMPMPESLISKPQLAPIDMMSQNYSSRGYNGTVGGYVDELNKAQPGAGDRWISRIKSLDEKARRMEFGF